MHAIVIHANITDLADAKQGLNDQVLPMMKGTRIPRRLLRGRRRHTWDLGPSVRD